MLGSPALIMDFRGEIHNSERQLAWYTLTIHFQNDSPLNFSEFTHFSYSPSKLLGQEMPLVFLREYAASPIKLHILSFNLLASATLNDPKREWGGIKYVFFQGAFNPGLQFLTSELLLGLYLCLVEELLICNLTGAFSPPHKIPGTF